VWYNQILFDTISVIQKYFSSKLSKLDCVSQAATKVFIAASQEFVELAKLIFANSDLNLRVKETNIIVTSQSLN
jgi:hypothetical protein